jgi:hypothetical protein
MTWIITVAVMKQRVNEIEQKIVKMAIDFGLSAREASDRLRAIDEDAARCDESRKSMQIAILRLEEVKASKEMMDSIRSDVHNLSALVNNRFTKIEELINKVFYDKKN